MVFVLIWLTEKLWAQCSRQLAQSSGWWKSGFRLLHPCLVQILTSN